MKGLGLMYGGLRSNHPSSRRDGEVETALVQGVVGLLRLQEGESSKSEPTAESLLD